jgi:flagellar biosynthesis protein FliR
MTQASFEQVLHHFGTGHIIGFFLVLARIAPLFVIAPLFSSKMLPTQVKTIVAAGVAIGLTPVATHGAHVSDAPLVIVALMVQNMLVGLAFSMAVAVVFAAVESAGALLDVLSGFSYGQLVNPMTGQQGGVLTNLYSIVGLALFIAIGGDAWMLKGIARTITLVPLTSAPDLRTLTGGVVSEVGTLFVAAIEIAAPAILALLIADIAFGMVSRVVPQINIFGVGFAVKVGVALLVVAASLPFIGGFMSNTLSSVVGTALQSL